MESLFFRKIRKAKERTSLSTASRRRGLKTYAFERSYKFLREKLRRRKRCWR
jgi:hypothetical protein